MEAGLSVPSNNFTISSFTTGVNIEQDGAGKILLIALSLGPVWARLHFPVLSQVGSRDQHLLHPQRSSIQAFATKFHSAWTWVIDSWIGPVLLSVVDQSSRDVGFIAAMSTVRVDQSPKRNGSCRNKKFMLSFCFIIFHYFFKKW